MPDSRPAIRDKKMIPALGTHSLKKAAGVRQLNHEKLRQTGKFYNRLTGTM